MLNIKKVEKDDMIQNMLAEILHRVYPFDKTIYPNLDFPKDDDIFNRINLAFRSLGFQGRMIDSTDEYSLTLSYYAAIILDSFQHSRLFYWQEFIFNKSYISSSAISDFSSKKEVIVTEIVAKIKSEISSLRVKISHLPVASEDQVTLNKSIQDFAKAINQYIENKIADHDYNQDLLHAVQHNKIDKVKTAIAQGADLNFKESGQSVLMIAAKNAYKGMVDCLLNLPFKVAKVDVNFEDDNHCTALLLATSSISDEKKLLSIVELLVTHGAKINHTSTAWSTSFSWNNWTGWTALHIAIWRGFKSVVSFLLKHHADPNARITAHNNYRDATPLHIAVKNNNFDIVKQLIDFRANPALADRDGNTPNKITNNRNILKALETRLKDIHYINFNDEMDGTSLLTLLSGQLKAHPNVPTVELRRCNLQNKSEWLPILTKLSQHQALLNLELQGSPLNEDIIAQLSESLIQKNNLQILVINEVGLGESSIKNLAFGLLQNKSLHMLDIGFNGLGDQLTIILIKSLKFHPQLRNLRLPGNNLTVESGVALLELLLQNNTLSSLLVDNNPSLPTFLENLLYQIANQNDLIRRSGSAPALDKTHYWQPTDELKGLSLAHLCAYYGAPLALLWLSKNCSTSVNVLDKYGDTILHQAVLGNADLELVKTIVEKIGVDVAIANHQGKTALHISAAIPDNHKVAAYLLSKMTDVEKLDNDGYCALQYATLAGNSLLVKSLLDAHNVNLALEDGTTLLMLSAKGLNRSVTKLLIEMGADVHAVDTQNNTALHHCAAAIKNTNDYDLAYELVLILIEAGIDVHARNASGKMARSLINDIDSKLADLLLNIPNQAEIEKERKIKNQQRLQEIKSRDIMFSQKIKSLENLPDYAKFKEMYDKYAVIYQPIYHNNINEVRVIDIPEDARWAANLIMQQTEKLRELTRKQGILERQLAILQEQPIRDLEHGDIVRKFPELNTKQKLSVFVTEELVLAIEAAQDDPMLLAERINDLASQKDSILQEKMLISAKCAIAEEVIKRTDDGLYVASWVVDLGELTTQANSSVLNSSATLFASHGETKISPHEEDSPNILRM
ncbi:MAG: ankyrin repeat domain-containing protein [Gammaproteobacteria bacterium]